MLSRCTVVLAIAAIEDAQVRVDVTHLGAYRFPVKKFEEFCRAEHTNEWRGHVNPKGWKLHAGDSRRDGTRRIYTES